MRVVHTVSELHAAMSPWKDAGDTVALVPTMGNLHAGHMELVRKARELAQGVVVSLFVNPLQFGPNEDFDKYPRTLESDTEMLEREGADLVFAPAADQIYPSGNPPATTVQVNGPLGEILCAPFRPGHFPGMATVVNIFFNLVAPQIAIFGEKDYQQLAIVRRMTADLALPIRIVGIPTSREADGLAMSSRNRYLSPDDRQRAVGMHKSLQWVAEQLARGRTDFETLSREGQGRLAKAGFNPQYLEVRAQDLSAPTADSRSFVVLAAAFLGTTRLIDNVSLTLDSA